MQRIPGAIISIFGIGLLLFGALAAVVDAQPSPVPAGTSAGSCFDDAGNGAGNFGAEGNKCINMTDCTNKKDGYCKSEPLACDDGSCGAGGVLCPWKWYEKVAQTGTCNFGYIDSTCLYCNNPKVGSAWFCCATGHMYINGTKNCTIEKCAFFNWINTTACTG